jgi:hypothetical protein
MRSFLVLACVTAVAAAPLAAQQKRAVEVFGFADFNEFSTKRPGVADGFRSGQLAGHASAELTPRLSFFTEATASPAANAAFNLEIERAILRYDFGDFLKISAGRYHTPISYWNTAYHHGQWLQTTANRPEMIKFGGTFLPVHFVGLLAEGSLGPGSLGLRYDAGLGNGRGTPNFARAGDAGDVNAHRAWTAGLALKPGALRHLQVGGAAYVDRVRPAAGAGVRERILAAHLVWGSERPELIAEYANARHEREGTGVTAHSEAGYVQLAYRLPGTADAFKPYARAERVIVPATDPLLTPVSNYTGLIAGLRWDFAPVAALKAEYRREKANSTVGYDTFVIQAAFTFPRWHEGEAAGAGVTP